VRHPEVEHDDIRPHPVEGSQRVEPVHRLKDLEVALEGHPVESPPSRIVVDHEHLHHQRHLPRT
jgi:hypothetical protein